MAYMTFASIGSHPPQSDARVHAQDVTLDRDGTTGLVRKNRLHRTHRTTVAFAGTRGTKPAFCTTTVSAERQLCALCRGNDLGTHSVQVNGCRRVNDNDWPALGNWSRRLSYHSESSPMRAASKWPGCRSRR